MQNIRNFSIIAHIDHGKSTLADRFIQVCGGLSEREMGDQVLDSMDLERERGITIKAQSVTLDFKAKNGQHYQLNFIDTPGHVDFSYEVSRSLSACEGALLVVDAGQGVEAQTVAVCYTALEQGLEVLPVLNKIDLPQAEPERVIQEIEDIIGIPAQDALRVSAKNGIGITELLERLIEVIPSPEGDPQAPLQALIIDSWFDSYLGVVSLVRVKQGILKTGEKMLVMSTGRAHHVDKVGVFTPKRIERQQLSAGEVGFVIAGIKDIHGAPVGDTLTHANKPAEQPLPGFKIIFPNPDPSLAGELTLESKDAGFPTSESLALLLDALRTKYDLQVPASSMQINTEYKTPLSNSEPIEVTFTLPNPRSTYTIINIPRGVGTYFRFSNGPDVLDVTPLPPALLKPQEVKQHHSTETKENKDSKDTKDVKEVKNSRIKLNPQAKTILAAYFSQEEQSSLLHADEDKALNILRTKSTFRNFDNVSIRRDLFLLFINIIEQSGKPLFRVIELLFEGNESFNWLINVLSTYRSDLNIHPYLDHPVLQEFFSRAISTPALLRDAATAVFQIDLRDRKNEATQWAIKLFLSFHPQLAHLVFDFNQNILDLVNPQIVADVSEATQISNSSLLRLVFEYAAPFKEILSSAHFDRVARTQQTNPTDRDIKFQSLTGTKPTAMSEQKQQLFDSISLHNDENGLYIWMVASETQQSEKFLQSLRKKKAKEITIADNLLYWRNEQGVSLPRKITDICQAGNNYFLRTPAGMQLVIAVAKSEKLLPPESMNLLNSYVNYCVAPGYLAQRVHTDFEYSLSIHQQLTVRTNKKYLRILKSDIHSDNLKRILESLAWQISSAIHDFDPSTEVVYLGTDPLRSLLVQIKLNTPRAILLALNILADLEPDHAPLLRDLMQRWSNIDLISQEQYKTLSQPLRDYANAGFLKNRRKHHQPEAREILAVLDSSATLTPAIITHVVASMTTHEQRTNAGKFPRYLKHLCQMQPIEETKPQTTVTPTQTSTTTAVTANKNPAQNGQTATKETKDSQASNRKNGTAQSTPAQVLSTQALVCKSSTNKTTHISVTQATTTSVSDANSLNPKPS